MLSTSSRSAPSNVYEAWIFLIRFLVSCIILHLTGWNLIPQFLGQEPNRSISIWGFIVSSSSLISLISRKQTQSSAKSLISDSVSDEMSFMYRENNKESRTVPWGTPDKTGAQSDFTPFTTTRCCLKKRTSRKLLRIKVTPDLHLTYSENGGNLGLVLKMKQKYVVSQFYWQNM